LFAADVKALPAVSDAPVAFCAVATSVPVGIGVDVELCSVTMSTDHLWLVEAVKVTVRALPAT
jgi:hypothetical protein